MQMRAGHVKTKPRLTKKQNETRLRGLRILARMIVRHHIASLREDSRGRPSTSRRDPEASIGQTPPGRRMGMAGKRPCTKVRLKAGAVWDRLNRLNMTQNDLARLVGVSSGYLSRLINGRRCPSPRMRQGLMEALDCSEFDDLFVVVSADE